MLAHERLAQLIEKMGKPGVMGVVGKRRERSCEHDLIAYFRLLANRLPIPQLAQLATSTDADMARHLVQTQTSNAIRGVRPFLLGSMKLQYEAGYHDGWRVAQVHPLVGKFQEADTPSGSPMDTLGPSGERAADFATTSAGTLVTGLDETTLEALQDAISTGIEERLGVDGLGRLIRSTVMDMTVKRAQVIATTEMNRAFSTAALEKMAGIGIEFKRWFPVDDPCPVCEDNEAEGAIPVNQVFSSGDDAPPAHPNCRCAVVGARDPEAEGA